jgi:KipI family sensor histidine kinase inhibitor
MRLLPYGDRGVLVELDSLEQVHRLHRAVLSARIATDAVPGWRSLLVTSDNPTALPAALERLAFDDDVPVEPRLQEIPVRYDGEDLAEVAKSCGLTEDEVVQLHLGATYTIAFLGFTRGFPYLSGLPEQLRLPRRPTPRTRVPAGSVAIALDQCGIYPSASPGGWHLIGSTDWTTFDETMDPPSSLAPGDRVRFVLDE